MSSLSDALTLLYCPDFTLDCCAFSLSCFASSRRQLIIHVREKVLNCMHTLLNMEPGCDLPGGWEGLTHPFAAASIWFEIWGSWIRVKIISIFPGNFTKKSIFPGKFVKIFDFFMPFHNFF